MTADNINTENARRHMSLNIYDEKMPLNWLLKCADIFLNFLQNEMGFQTFPDPIMRYFNPTDMAKCYFPPRCVIGVNYTHLVSNWPTIIKTFVNHYFKGTPKSAPIFTARITWATDILINSFSVLRIIPLSSTIYLSILRNKNIEYDLFRLFELLQDNQHSLDHNEISPPECALRNLLREHMNIDTPPPKYPPAYPNTALFIKQLLKNRTDELALTGIHVFDKRYGFKFDKADFDKTDQWQVQFISRHGQQATFDYIKNRILPAYANKGWTVSPGEDIIIAGRKFGTKFVIKSLDQNQQHYKARTSIYAMASHIVVPFASDKMPYNYINMFILLYNMIIKKIHMANFFKTNYGPIIWRCLYYTLYDNIYNDPNIIDIIGPFKIFGEFMIKPRIVRCQPNLSFAPPNSIDLPNVRKLINTDSIIGRGMVLNEMPAEFNNIYINSKKHDNDLTTPTACITPLLIDDDDNDDDEEDITDVITTFDHDVTLVDRNNLLALNNNERIALENKLLHQSYSRRSERAHCSSVDIKNLEEALKSVTMASQYHNFDGIEIEDVTHLEEYF